jgi:peptide/nickel transport system ATP-binding protein
MQLEARGLGFGYERRAAVIDDFDLSIRCGERVALVGASGCGKSTLCKMLAGMLTPHRGEILWNGAPLPTQGYRPVQLIYQHPEQAVNPRWRLRDTLNEGWECDEQTLLSLGIEPTWLDRWPNELSAGELQRICIARALSPQTRILIADEISTMLDVITQAQLWRWIMTVAEQRGMGVLVVTHNRALSERLCERVISL